MRLNWLSILCGLALLCGRPAAAPAQEAAGGASDPVADARQLLGVQRPLDAIKLLEAAYQQRQQPRLLCLLGEAHELLGDAPKAQGFYQRCLVSASGELELRREAAGRLGRLRPFLPAPSVVAAPSPYRVERRAHHRGMLSAGITLLSIGYAGAFATGLGVGIPSVGSSSYYGSSRSSYNQAAAGSLTLLIPVAGPVISAGVWNELILPWGLPWLLCGLPMQVTGLALIIQGYRTPQRVLVPAGLDEPDDRDGRDGRAALPVQVLPYAAPGGGGLVALGSF